MKSSSSCNTYSTRVTYKIIILTYKSEIRIKKTVYNTDIGMRHGGEPLWHHLDCFSQIRYKLGWPASGDQLAGFSDLDEPDQMDVQSVILCV